MPTDFVFYQMVLLVVLHVFTIIFYSHQAWVTSVCMFVLLCIYSCKGELMFAYTYACRNVYEKRQTKKK